MRTFVTTAALLVACVSQAAAQSAEALPESPGSIEYKTVAEALTALKDKPGVRVDVTKPDGWIIASEGRDIVWSFTPEGHYAHPAVVRRALVARPGGDLFMDMRALCQAPKAPCDKLMQEFAELNERMRQSVQQKLRQQK